MSSSYHERYRAEQMRNLEFQAEYERARAEIAQVNEVVRRLDLQRITPEPFASAPSV
jgi:hypothetical protein